MKKHQAPSKQTAKTSANPVQPKVTVPSKVQSGKTKKDQTNSQYKYIDPNDVYVGAPKWFSQQQSDYCKKVLLQAYEHGQPTSQQPCNPQVQQYFMTKIREKFGQNLNFKNQHLKIYTQEKEQKIQKYNGQPFLVQVRKSPNFVFSFWKPI